MDGPHPRILGMHAAAVQPEQRNREFRRRDLQTCKGIQKIANIFSQSKEEDRTSQLNSTSSFVHKQEPRCRVRIQSSTKQ